MTTLSPVDVRPERWRILSRYREGERTLAEWKQVFAGYPPEDFPLLKIEGSVATVVRCPDTGCPLQVFRCYNGTYSARAPAEDEVDGLDNMTIEDVRLYRLDWPAHCQAVAQHLGLKGQIRGMPELPWFWRIGDLQTAAVFYPYFMAVIRENPDADIVGKSLKFTPEARLIVPSLSDWAFDRLTELNNRFHVLADGTPPHFPAVATEIKENATIRKANPDTSAEIEEYVFRRLGKKGDYWKIVFEGNELQPVRHLAGMTYIHALLSHPGKQYPVQDIYEIENPPPPQPEGNAMSPEEREKYGTGGSHQTVLDKLTTAQLKKAKALLEAQLGDSDLSDNQRDGIEGKIETIKTAMLNSQVARATGGATFEDKATKQSRQTVSKSIKAAFNALADMKYGHELVKHLRYAIRKGKTLMYPPGLSWSWKT